MKKTYGVLLLTALVTLALVCGNAVADSDGVGPAPNAGDGVPDGSGFDRTEWPNEESPGKGPAPNAGDCIPDGSGF